MHYNVEDALDAATSAAHFYGGTVKRPDMSGLRAAVVPVKKTITKKPAKKQPGEKASSDVSDPDEEEEEEEEEKDTHAHGGDGKRSRPKKSAAVSGGSILAFAKRGINNCADDAKGDPSHPAKKRARRTVLDSDEEEEEEEEEAESDEEESPEPRRRPIHAPRASSRVIRKAVTYDDASDDGDDADEKEHAGDATRTEKDATDVFADFTFGPAADAASRPVRKAGEQSQSQSKSKSKSHSAITTAPATTTARAKIDTKNASHRSAATGKATPMVLAAAPPRQHSHRGAGTGSGKSLYKDASSDDDADLLDSEDDDADDDVDDAADASSDEDDDDGGDEVERIVCCRPTPSPSPSSSSLEYLVKWAGVSYRRCEWLDASTMHRRAPHKLVAFMRRHYAAPETAAHPPQV